MLQQDTRKIVLFGIIYTATRGLVGAISIAYMAFNGLSLSDIGIIKGWQVLILLIFDIPLAYFSDRRSKKISLIASMVFCCMWMLTTSFSHTMLHFMIAEFFNSLFLALSGGAFVAYLINSDSNKKNIKYILSKYSQWQFLALGVSGFLGAAFIDIGNRDIWILCSIIMIIQFIFFIFYLPPDRTNKFTVPSISIIQIIKENRNEKIKFLFLNAILAGLFYQSLIQFWQPSVIQNFSVDDGIVYSSIFLSILLSQSFAGWMSSKNYDGIIVLVAVSTFITLLTLSEYIFSFNSLYFFGVNLCCYMFISKLLSLKISTAFHELVKDDYRATAEAILATLSRIFFLFLLPLVGLSIHLYNYKITFIILLLLSLFVYLIFDKYFSLNRKYKKSHTL